MMFKLLRKPEKLPLQPARDGRSSRHLDRRKSASLSCRCRSGRTSQSHRISWNNFVCRKISYKENHVLLNILTQLWAHLNVLLPPDVPTALLLLTPAAAFNDDYLQRNWKVFLAFNDNIFVKELTSILPLRYFFGVPVYGQPLPSVLSL